MSKSHDTIIREAQRRFKAAQDHWSDIYDEYHECLKFKHGEQWPEGVAVDRGDDRPALVFNRIAGHINHLVGNERQNRPSIKVLPIEDSDDEAADLRSGVIRAIEAASDAEEAYDTAYECALSGGIGAFRVNVSYSDDDTFKQDIRIESIPNPLTVMVDPASKKMDGSDAKWIFVSERMTRDEFKARWPKVEVPTAGLNDESDAWLGQDDVRVAEYWYKKPTTKTILLMSDGSTLDAEELMHDQELAQASAHLSVVRERTVKTHKVCKALIGGSQVLEEVEWPGRHIPIIVTFGRVDWIDGKRRILNIVKPAMDAQRLYNYLRSQEAEALSLAPKAPWMVTAQMIEGYEDLWDESSVKNRSVLVVNATEDGLPQRIQPATVQTGYEAAAAQMVDEIKAATGQFDASMGSQSNEISGKAIMARQRQGETSTFEFIDNLSRSIAYAGRIIVDLLPRVYSYQRMLRVLGEDGDSKEVKVNEQKRDDTTGDIVQFNDMTVGKFDVRVTTGPSYATQRVEAADSMMQFMQAVPGSSQLIGDLIARNMAWPGAQQIADRLKTLLPPGMDDSEEATPEVQQMQQQMQQMQQALQQTQSELADKNADIEMRAAEIRIKEYDAETKRIQALSSNHVAPQAAEVADQQMEQEYAEALQRQEEQEAMQTQGTPQQEMMNGS